MTKRFFAFGCSYTKYSYATWADFVGASFDEYYNYGRGGASNTFIMNRVVEANEVFNFNKETDTVFVMISGIGRYSYFHKNDWVTNGDLYSYYANTKDRVVKNFVEDMWSEEWAIYQSWIAVKTIRQILKDIPHKILMSIDNRHYLEEDGSKWGKSQVIRPETINKVKDIYDILDVNESMDEWMKKHYTRNDFYVWKDHGKMDQHPTQKMHYDFVREKLTDFATDKSNELFDKLEKSFDISSQRNAAFSFLENTMDLSKDRFLSLFGAT